MAALDGTEFFELEVESGIDSFSIASNAESTNFALLRRTVPKLDGGEERSEVIDVRKQDRFNRKLIVKRALATTTTRKNNFSEHLF
ncbi:hypothetical protein ACSBR2_014826 [Camellia fascicularis]